MWLKICTYVQFDIAFLIEVLARYFMFNCHLLPLAVDCTASAPNDWSCCNKKFENNEKCNENEGDCDSDIHCRSGLKCGTNNCPSGFPSSFDCCYNPVVITSG